MDLGVTWAATKQKLGLIESCKAEWRKVSTWITAVAGVLWGLFAAFPTIAATAWNALPSDMRDNIPHKDWIAFACLAAVFVAKFVKQSPKQDCTQPPQDAGHAD